MSDARGRRRWLWIAAIAAAVFFGYRYWSAPMDIVQAVDTRQVEATTAVQDDGTRVSIRLTRGSNAGGTVHGVIAAGTILYGGGEGTQRLMTAVPLSFVLSDTSPSANYLVKTFCVDEFADIPASGTRMSFLPGSGDRRMTTEETEPLHKLANCMASSSLSNADQQAVVWAVRDNLLDKAPADLLQFWTRGLEEAIARQQRAKLDGEGRQRLAAKYSLLSSEDLDQIVENVFRSEREAISRQAEQKAREQLAGLQRARETLGGCGYDVSALRAFR